MISRSTHVYTDTVHILASSVKLGLQYNNNSQQITATSMKGGKTEHMLVDSCIGCKEMPSYRECSWQIKIHNLLRCYLCEKEWRREACVASYLFKRCRDDLGSDKGNSHHCTPFQLIQQHQNNKHSLKRLSVYLPLFSIFRWSATKSVKC